MDVVIPWYGIIPFVIMLLCIAILPLIPATAEKWEDWRFQLTIALILGVPVAIWVGFLLGWWRVGHAVFEYVQFIMLLFSLFVVSGGLYLAGDIRATPRNNTVMLAIGGAIASFVGTTGAAMLLIRPILNINKQRKNIVHVVIFTILIVGNNGGLLTPLGDPPLFMGFLRGVPFTWTFSLIPEWLFVNGLLLLSFFALDTKVFSTEKFDDLVQDYKERQPIRVLGLPTLVWFAMIIIAVAVVPSMDLHAIEEGTAVWHEYVPWRELVFVTAAAGSYFTGSKKIRWELNQFEWGPIREVAVIFIGIFLTMIMALEFLSQEAGGWSLNTTSFYLITGSLSAFLDNAPTYATFFEIARSIAADPAILPEMTRIAGVPEMWLAAISLGSVTMGAMTYIGNGPNFMIKSVADSRGVAMPSFGGYIGWSLRYLFPILIAMMLIFLTESTITHVVGWVLTAALIIFDVLTIIKHRKMTATLIDRSDDDVPVEPERD